MVLNVSALPLHHADLVFHVYHIIAERSLYTTSRVFICVSTSLAESTKKTPNSVFSHVVASQYRVTKYLPFSCNTTTRARTTRSTDAKVPLPDPKRENKCLLHYAFCTLSRWARVGFGPKREPNASPTRGTFAILHYAFSPNARVCASRWVKTRVKPQNASDKTRSVIRA